MIVVVVVVVVVVVTRWCMLLEFFAPKENTVHGPSHCLIQDGSISRVNPVSKTTCLVAALLVRLGHKPEKT